MPRADARMCPVTTSARVGLVTVGVSLALAATLAGCGGTTTDGGVVGAVLPLVPAPVRADALGGQPFTVTASTAVVAAPGTDDVAALVARALGGPAGGSLPVRTASDEPEKGAGLVVLALSDEVPDEPSSGDRRSEAYRLTAGPQGVRLTARTVAGLHRAAATLSQLVVATDGEVTVPAVEVSDAPRYGWRGLSVDVARHFLPVDDLRRIVDLVAAYKLNVLHLHLTDDQGWRIALPSRPELAERSSGTSVGGDPGGHYTADDVAGLVAYAAARGVSVVPEVDVPGHVNAALHAVPELNPSGVAEPEYTGVDVGFSALRASVPATRPFLDDVFGDLAAMVPGEYVHVGGDEAFEVGGEEYAQLVGAAVDAVAAAGKRVVGWQEIATVPLPAGTVVQYWQERSDPAPVIAAARAGARVLMSPATRAYLDMQYVPGYQLGQDWAGYTELRDAYEWDPDSLLPGLDPGAVIGVEAAVWTETLRSFDDVTQMLLPRLAAVAEVAWSAGTDWESFRGRVAPHAAAWDRAGLTWYASPQVAWVR